MYCHFLDDCASPEECGKKGFHDIKEHWDCDDGEVRHNVLFVSVKDVDRILIIRLFTTIRVLEELYQTLNNNKLCLILSVLFKIRCSEQPQLTYIYERMN